MASMDRDYLRYAVYWPGGPGVSPRRPMDAGGHPTGVGSPRFIAADGQVSPSVAPGTSTTSRDARSRLRHGDSAQASISGAMSAM